MRRSPIRRIPWDVLKDEDETADQVWSSLPDKLATHENVRAFLQNEGLVAAEGSPNILYAYADGPQVMGSPVQSEWYLEFRFEGDQLVELGVEKRLIGP